MNFCSIDGCAGGVVGWGWCNKHYVRWKLTGDPLGSTKRKTVDLFWIKVNKHGPVTKPELGPCWLWTATCNQDGYGRFRNNGVLCSAHRVSYEWEYGGIPEGKELDHKCSVRNCVRPSHLRPMTHKKNVLIGKSFSAANAKKTHCPKGHEYTPENIYRFPKTGGRKCRICGRAATAAWARRKRKEQNEKSLEDAG